jgi:hypothetical protein
MFHVEHFESITYALGELANRRLELLLRCIFDVFGAWHFYAGRQTDLTGHPEIYQSVQNPIGVAYG